MKIVGAGLSKTGTMSLKRALVHLGFTTLHNDMDRLNSVVGGSSHGFDFRVYDDIDAAVDLPTACYFEELLAAYPNALCILTVRNEDAWWRSVNAHFKEIFPLSCRDEDPLRWDVRATAYGSADPQEKAFRRRYREHNARVRAKVPLDRLLIMDIVAGDGWDALCGFLECEIPNVPFPHGNKREILKHNARVLNLRDSTRNGT